MGHWTAPVGVDLESLVIVEGIRIRLNVKIKKDSGRVIVPGSGVITMSFVSVFSTPKLSTEVRSFIDVQNITTTAKAGPGGTLRHAIYDFVDVPNPATFDIYLYNAAGVPIGGEVGWQVEGI